MRKSKKDSPNLSIRKKFVKWSASGYHTITVEEPPKKKKLASGKIIVISEGKTSTKVDFSTPTRTGIVLDDMYRDGKVFRQYPELAMCNHVSITFSPLGEDK